MGSKPTVRPLLGQLVRRHVGHAPRPCRRLALLAPRCRPGLIVSGAGVRLDGGSIFGMAAAEKARDGQDVEGRVPGAGDAVGSGGMWWWWWCRHPRRGFRCTTPPQLHTPYFPTSTTLCITETGAPGRVVSRENTTHRVTCLRPPLQAKTRGQRLSDGKNGRKNRPLSRPRSGPEGCRPGAGLVVVERRRRSGDGVTRHEKSGHGCTAAFDSKRAIGRE